MKRKALVSWSSGKDSAWALHLAQSHANLEVVGLLTTVNQQFDRVAMHGTRRTVLEAQAAAAGLPLDAVPLPWPCSNTEYECAMQAACDRAAADGIEVIVFGDLFLREIRAYREKQLAGTHLSPWFPLWDMPTAALAREMIAGGLRAKLVCVDPKKLDGSFAGRDFDEKLLRELPAEIDPCGENGEFHTCVYAGPMFKEVVGVRCGEVVQRDGFVYADVMVTDKKRF